MKYFTTTDNKKVIRKKNVNQTRFVKDSFKFIFKNDICLIAKHDHLSSKNIFAFEQNYNL